MDRHRRHGRHGGGPGRRRRGPRCDAERFTVYRVRFQLLNDADKDAIVRPGSRRSPADAGWADVPLRRPRSWRAVLRCIRRRARCSRLGGTTIAVADLRLGTAARSRSRSRSPGQSSAGLHPRRPSRCRPTASPRSSSRCGRPWTPTGAAPYQFRLARRPPGPRRRPTAELVMRAKPAVELSPGQRQGEPVDDPVPLYRLDPSIGMTDMRDVGSDGERSTAAYALRPPVAAPNTGSSRTCTTGWPRTRARPATQPMLPRARCCSGSRIRSRRSASRCHDGTGASERRPAATGRAPLVARQRPATSSWYSHPATTPSNHQSARENEFGGSSTGTRRALTATSRTSPTDRGRSNSVGGWTASGAIAGASGRRRGERRRRHGAHLHPRATSTFEYQLCFKCHSGFTKLPAQDPAHPEPVGAGQGRRAQPGQRVLPPGRGRRARTRRPRWRSSLSGTSPYKLWAFETDDTVRCLNCHGDSAVGRARPTPPAARTRASTITPVRTAGS